MPTYSCSPHWPHRVPDPQRAPFAFCIGVTSVLLVTIVAAVVQTLLARAPLIFLRLAETQFGQIDAVLTPSPYSGFPALNYTQFKEALAAGPDPIATSFHAPRVILPIIRAFAAAECGSHPAVPAGWATTAGVLSTDWLRGAAAASACAAFDGGGVGGLSLVAVDSDAEERMGVGRAWDASPADAEGRPAIPAGALRVELGHLLSSREHFRPTSFLARHCRSVYRCRRDARDRSCPRRPPRSRRRRRPAAGPPEHRARGPRPGRARSGPPPLAGRGRVARARRGTRVGHAGRISGAWVCPSPLAARLERCFALRRRCQLSSQLRAARPLCRTRRSCGWSCGRCCRRSPTRCIRGSRGGFCSPRGHLLRLMDRRFPFLWSLLQAAPRSLLQSPAVPGQPSTYPALLPPLPAPQPTSEPSFQGACLTDPPSARVLRAFLSTFRRAAAWLRTSSPTTVVCAAPLPTLRPTRSLLPGLQRR